METSGEVTGRLSRPALAIEKSCSSSNKLFPFLKHEICIPQVKVQGQNQEMLLAACEQFLGKAEKEIRRVALETLEGHQRAIMGSMTVEVCEIFRVLFILRLMALLAN